MGDDDFFLLTAGLVLFDDCMEVDVVAVIVLLVLLVDAAFANLAAQSPADMIIVCVCVYWYSVRL